MPPATEEDAAHRRDVRVVPPPAQHHVFVAHHEVVGWIEIDSAVIRPEPDANPSMAVMSPAPLFCAVLGASSDVAKTERARIPKARSAPMIRYAKSW